jgi:hypothetical protein
MGLAQAHSKGGAEMLSFTYLADFGDGCRDTDGAVVLFVRGEIRATSKADAARRVHEKCPDAIEIRLAWTRADDTIIHAIYRKHRGRMVPLRVHPANVTRADIRRALAEGPDDLLEKRRELLENRLGLQGDF